MGSGSAVAWFRGWEEGEAGQMLPRLGTGFSGRDACKWVEREKRQWGS